MENQPPADEETVPAQEIEETVTADEEFVQLLTFQRIKLGSGSGQKPLICPVPRLLKQRSHVYDPEVVTIGPYHYGKEGLIVTDDFKYKCLDWFANGDDDKMSMFYYKILEKIPEIRGCYAEASIDSRYYDKKLAWMMLLDASFIVRLMSYPQSANSAPPGLTDLVGSVGLAASLVFSDTILVENQIPLEVVKLLISLRSEEESGHFVITLVSFARWICGFLGLVKPIENPHLSEKPNGKPHSHLLEACWEEVCGYVDTEDIILDVQWPWVPGSTGKDDHVDYCRRSVMELKSKGIQFVRSATDALSDIRFDSWAFHGKLHLPTYYVMDVSKVFFTNMIAYEVSPESGKKPVVLSYVNLMKSLLERPEDVKELHEKGILINRLANHDQVIKMFEELNTFGLTNVDTLFQLRQRIEVHCKSKGKTWINELIHTHFRTPWTAIGFFAGVFIIVLSFLQTYYTIRSTKK